MTPGEAPDPEEEKKAKEDYDKWRASASKASPFQESIVASGQGWLWVFFGLSGRLEQRRYFIATVFSWILFIASLHYVLSTYYDSTYFGIYTGSGPWWLGFLWAWVIFGYLSYAITSKRLADLDLEPMAALGLLVIIIIPFLGPFLQIVAWLALLVTPGTEGSNNHGPEPTVSVNARNAGPGRRAGTGCSSAFVAGWNRSGSLSARLLWEPCLFLRYTTRSG